MCFGFKFCEIGHNKMIFNDKTTFKAYNGVRYCFTTIGTPRIHIKDLEKVLKDWKCSKCLPIPLQNTFDNIKRRIGKNAYLDLYTLMRELPTLDNDLKLCMNLILSNVYKDYLDLVKKQAD